MTGEVKVLLFRGTGAPLEGDGVMQEYKKNLGSWADVEFVNYPATYGKPSYDVSLQDGIAMGLNALRKTDKKAIVAGFSQGADVAGYIHALLNGAMPNERNHNLAGCEVSYSFTVADPSRDYNARLVNGTVGGWGIRGPRPIGLNSFGVANPGDPICAYPDGPLRSFADFSAYFGDEEAVKKIWELANKKKLQPWWTQPNPADWFRNWGNTVGWLNNYFSGYHYDQYLQKGFVRMLSDKTNELARATLLL